MTNESLPSDVVAQIADGLSKLEPGYLPLPIFLQVARLVALPITEIVPLRRSGNGAVEVLMTKRPDDDLYFAGMLHTPGTVIRATDTEGSHASAFARILDEELGGVATGAPVFVETLLHFEVRGMADAHIYYVEVSGEPTLGEFYDVDNLPENTMQSQLGFIKAAAEAFKRAN